MNLFLSLSPIILIFKRKFSVSDITDFPVAMLNNGLSPVILNGFAISLSACTTSLAHAFAFFIPYDRAMA